MPARRDIDERDVDRILAALTDTQIAALYGMSEIEVFRLRRSREAVNAKPKNSPKKSPKNSPEDSKAHKDKPAS